MRESGVPTGRVDFPHLPSDASAGDCLRGLRLRPFGEGRADLDLDFGRQVRPALVTEALRCCTSDAEGRPLDKRFFWDLPVSLRMHALVLLWLMSGRARDVAVRCADENCDADFEVTAPLEELLEVARVHDSTGPVEIVAGDRLLRLRLPIGADLSRWAESPPSRTEIVGQLLLDDLEIDSATDSRVFNLIENALSEADPLVDLELDGECPHCGCSFCVTFDLEAEALRVLELEQRDLLDAIDHLARVYHWTEPEIVALPRWRRQAYLDRVAEEPQ